MSVLTSREQLQTDLNLEPIKNVLQAEGDFAGTLKLEQLQQKIDQEQFTMAFCGHFSAGKSSLINRLCGKKILPSSPIPTSANIVAIRNGQPRAVITKMPDVSGAPKELLNVPLGDLEAYCKNGTDFESVELFDELPFLGTKGCLLDTPGVDSTDEGHRMSTESALHLADVVFYVMDYNHVQSEINFTFAKQLADWGKPLYLVVNQIDKHRERELPFETYRKSVEQAFAHWNLKPAGIIYLSLKQPDHPQDEWFKLNWLIGELIKKGDRLCRYSVECSTAQVMEEHLRWNSQKLEPQRQQYIDEMGGTEQAELLADSLHRLEEEQLQVQSRVIEVQERFKRDLNTLLDNANIIPAETRDRAHLYLESQKPGFKVGFLFSGGKTAAEQERRLESLHTHFMEQLKVQIDWHLGDLLRNLAEQADVPEVEWSLSANDISAAVTPVWLASQVNANAGFTNEYTMNYSKQISAEVKALYRKQALTLADRLLERLAALCDAKAAQLGEQHAQLLARSAALAALRRLEHSELARAERLRELLHAARSAADTSGLLPDVSQAAPRRGEDGGAPAPAISAAGGPAQPPAAAAVPLARPAAGAPAPAFAAARVREAGRAAAERLRRAEALLAPYPAMKSLGAGLARKAERLGESRFTIALFGAFSAGKSSFANALIGEDVLPVSPNPTTAAINQMMAPTPEFPHGTAQIVMKTYDAMWEDIRFSLSMLGTPLSDPSRMLETIRSLKPEQVQPAGRPHYSFLKAVAKGWAAAEKLLGQQFRVEMEEYRAYVAEESKSCFVQVIHLYYNCPLTEQGVILVDTPGADSINARHTGVSFNYIKNADAILFVTYYNHAFSQADRQFLQQLGRVKDAFELDKMFFIVNAADLASSQEELEGVLSYVETNLLEYGIRFPRLYPVSSINALDAKLQQDQAALDASGLPAFEQQFIRFTMEELGQMAIKSGEQDIVRAQNMIRGWIELANSDEAHRQTRLEQLRTSVQNALSYCQELEQVYHADEKRIAQEVQELLYYVKQRIRFRFGELYNYAFNPGTLRNDGQDLRKALQSCALEMHRLLGLDLSQELLATTLRLEMAVKRMALGHVQSKAEQIASVLAGYESPALVEPTWEGPEVQEQLSSPALDLKTMWSFFKNPKSFFEGEGKGRLKQELENSYGDPLQETVAEHQQTFERYYLDRYKEVLSTYAEQLRESVREQSEGQQASLSQQNDVQKLRQLISDLNA